MDALVSLDQYVLQSLYAVRDPILTDAFIWVSELGRVFTIVGLSAIALLLLITKRHYAYAFGLAVSVSVSGLGVTLGKALIERARPDEFYQAYAETWYSFPSAHAALAAAFYGFLAYLAWRMLPPFWRTLSLIFGFFLIGAVTFSRLYLGVHFLSDVLAGLFLGAVSAWIGAVLVRYVRV